MLEGGVLEFGGSLIKNYLAVPSAALYQNLNVCVFCWLLWVLSDSALSFLLYPFEYWLEKELIVSRPAREFMIKY